MLGPGQTLALVLLRLPAWSPWGSPVEGACLRLKPAQGRTGQSADQKGRQSWRESWYVGTRAKGTAYGPHLLCDLLQARGFSLPCSFYTLCSQAMSHRLVSTPVCELQPERQGWVFTSCVPTPSTQHVEVPHAQRTAVTRFRVCVGPITELSSEFPDLKTQGGCLYQK